MDARNPTVWFWPLRSSIRFAVNTLQPLLQKRKYAPIIGSDVCVNAPVDV